MRRRLSGARTAVRFLSDHGEDGCAKGRDLEKAGEVDQSGNQTKAMRKGCCQRLHDRKLLMLAPQIAPEPFQIL